MLATKLSATFLAHWQKCATSNSSFCRGSLYTFRTLHNFISPIEYVNGNRFLFPLVASNLQWHFSLLAKRKKKKYKSVFDFHFSNSQDGLFIRASRWIILFSIFVNELLFVQTEKLNPSSIAKENPTPINISIYISLKLTFRLLISLWYFHCAMKANANTHPLFSAILQGVCFFPLYTKNSCN